MKVFFVNSVCGIGSTGRICTDLADELVKNGDSCEVAYGRGTAPERFREISRKLSCEPRVRWNAAKARLLDNEGFNAAGPTRRLVERIRAFDPDVIHLHNLHGYYLNVEILFDYLRGCGKKIVWTLHDCWPMTGHCAHFVLAGCDKWETLCANCPRTGSYPKAVLKGNAERNYLRKKACFSDVPGLTIVTPSAWLAELVGRSFLRETETVVIHNGIDTEVFRPCQSDFRARYRLENKRIILGVSSVWSDEKGLRDFLTLSELLDEDTRIVLVGLSDEQLRRLPENVIGIRRTNNAAELAEIYSEADVFFNPTRQDTYPTVNLEAQACGTPVVTYPTGGSVESVPPENVIPAGDLEAFLRKLEGPLETAKLDFSKQTMMREYIKLYRK